MLSKEQYEKIKNYYWVQDEYPTKEGIWHNWFFGKEPPRSIGSWRHPFYAEAKQRQLIYTYDPERFFKRHETLQGTTHG